MTWARNRLGTRTGWNFALRLPLASLAAHSTRGPRAVSRARHSPACQASVRSAPPAPETCRDSPVAVRSSTKWAKGALALTTARTLSEPLWRLALCAVSALRRTFSRISDAGAGAGVGVGISTTTAPSMTSSASGCPSAVEPSKRELTSGWTPAAAVGATSTVQVKSTAPSGMSASWKEKTRARTAVQSTPAVQPGGWKPKAVPFSLIAVLRVHDVIGVSASKAMSCCVPAMLWPLV